MTHGSLEAQTREGSGDGSDSCGRLWGIARGRVMGLTAVAGCGAHHCCSSVLRFGEKVQGLAPLPPLPSHPRQLYRTSLDV
jgi:hypothetical protein